jgi:predicted dehydrogenase
MNAVRIGVIGFGNMGAAHVGSILQGKVPRMQVTAVCESELRTLNGPPVHSSIAKFTNSRALIRSGEVDAVLITTPHYSHTSIGVDALEQGLHVLVEKPISVHKADCERLIAAHVGREKQVFAAMFNQRTDPFYQRIRSLIQGGELGEIRRINWIITNWFRTEAYYASGGWRATWAGEGGGVLLNQCPHNLDLWQWLVGMPKSVRAFCRFGRYHDIEVEDDVTAYLEYPNGASGVFITTTGEAPGTNRLEITGERGRLIYENDRLTFTRNEIEMSQFSRTAKGGFVTPPIWEVNIPISGHGDQHIGIMKNFADAVLDQAPLIAPAAEGIHSVELANAMLLSTLTSETVELPMNGALYEERLKKLAADSRKKTPSAPSSGPAADFSQSFR